jgi:His/Glu/Gln/Arg/opine family amino acid ABC transporter permease subunit
MNFVVIMKQLFGGMSASVMIFALTLLFSMPLGLVVAFGRMSKWAPLGFLAKKDGKNGFLRLTIATFRPIQFIVKIIIAILRGTPLMLQLLVVFYGPFYLFGVQLPRSYRLIAVLLGFSINYAAYFAEIYRAGIESIPVGQYEAAFVLGYNKSQTFRKIILPQMVKRILPPVTNEVITLVKDTSLAFVLAYAEMFTVAKQIAAAKTSIMPLFVAGVFYFIFNFVVAFVMERIEKALSYYR